MILFLCFLFFSFLFLFFWSFSYIHIRTKDHGLSSVFIILFTSIVKCCLFLPYRLRGLSWLAVHGFLSLTIIIRRKFGSKWKRNKPIKQSLYLSLSVCMMYPPRTFSSEISIISENEEWKFYSKLFSANQLVA